MRRSASISTPLLACAAASLLVGCSLPGECLPEKQSEPCPAEAKSVADTVFGGFGNSFSDNIEIGAFIVAFGFIMIFGKSGGG